MEMEMEIETCKNNKNIGLRKFEKK